MTLLEDKQRELRDNLRKKLKEKYFLEECYKLWEHKEKEGRHKRHIRLTTDLVEVDIYPNGHTVITNNIEDFSTSFDSPESLVYYNNWKEWFEKIVINGEIQKMETLLEVL